MISIDGNEMNDHTLGYLRKSEEDKKRQVLSLDDQATECDKLIHNHALTLVATYFKEEKSAKVAGKRVEFYKMLELLKAGKANVIVCWAANRLARNVKDGAEIIDLVQNKGLRIITPYTQFDYSNWFMLMFEFGMATDYSLKLSKDVKRGLESKVAKGIRPGLALLGYINVGEIQGEKTIESDPLRFDLCKKWWQIMLTGNYTLDQSLEKITKLGLRNKKGKKISRTAAYRFFHDIFYAGYFEWLGEIHKGIHNPMVTLEEYNKVQKIITGKFNGKYEHPWEIKPAPLSGFIKCGECGATITADRKVKKYKNGESQEFRWYRCKKNSGSPCSQRAYLATDDLEAQVITYINNLELDPRFIEWVKAVLRRRNKEEFEFDKKQKEMLSRRLLELSEKKERAYGMKIDGLYSSEQEYKKKVGEILKEEVEVREQLKSERISYWGKVIDDTLNFASRVFELFNSNDPYVKKMVLQILGSDLRLKDKKLYLEAKSVFIFLRNKQNELFKENGLVGLKEMPLEQANQAKPTLFIPSGAGDGDRTHDLPLGKGTFYH